MVRRDEALDDSLNTHRGVSNGRRFPTQVHGGPGLPGDPTQPWSGSKAHFSVPQHRDTPSDRYFLPPRCPGVNTT